jgi:hypothetical protein
MGGAEVYAHPLPENMPFPEIVEGPAASVTTLPKDADYEIEVTSDPLPAHIIQQIVAPQSGLRLYAIGLIKYVDVFKKEWETKFCVSVIPDDQLLSLARGGGETIHLTWHHSPQHNEAT